VVIRSIAINRELRIATTHVGGAITILSDPQQEYEECLLKAESMFNSAR
jgi:para-aminobenzoate synthetase component 1